MLTPEQKAHFEVCGFVLLKQLFSKDEVAKLSDAWDEAMSRAREGAPAPVSGERRQQVVPFFDYDPDTFYPLLDDERIVGTLRDVMGDDMLLTVSEGILHTGGTGWHHDACAPDGFFSGRMGMYLDELEFDQGCLCVIPGSHHPDFRKALVETIKDLGVKSSEIPGMYPVVNEPGDVLFMNHKTFHASLSDNPGRRAIHINAVQNTTPEKNQEHFDWLKKFLEGETNGWGRFYSDRLINTADEARRKMLDPVMALGLGNTGKITHLQDLQ